MKTRTFQQIIEDAGLEPSAYSGRSMGGEECLSFTYERGALGRVMAEIVGEIRENADQEAIVAALPRMREDSLGTGTVVYFPGIPFTP